MTPEQGTLIADIYEVTAVLARGGMGDVCAAKRKPDDKLVAVKLLRAELRHLPDAAERFRREALAAKKIRSEHAAQVIDVVDDETYGIAIVFELLEGETLDELLKRESVLSIEEAHPIISQVISGLADAHAVQVVHRDLKPGNVFLEKRADGTTHAKILDFGVSKLPRQLGLEVLTKTGQNLGSFSYMAPEQIGRPSSVDPRADLYACGCLIFRMLTGQLPYAARGVADLLTKKQHQEARTLNQAQGPNQPPHPPELQSFVAKLLAINPDQRYSSAWEALEGWEAFAPLTGDTERRPALVEQQDEPSTKLGAPAPSVSPLGALGTPSAVPRPSGVPRPPRPRTQPLPSASGSGSHSGSGGFAGLGATFRRTSNKPQASIAGEPLPPVRDPAPSAPTRVEMGLSDEEAEDDVSWDAFDDVTSREGKALAADDDDDPTARGVRAAATVVDEREAISIEDEEEDLTVRTEGDAPEEQEDQTVRTDHPPAAGAPPPPPPQAVIPPPDEDDEEDLTVRTPGSESEEPSPSAMAPALSPSAMAPAPPPPPTYQEPLPDDDDDDLPTALFEHPVRYEYDPSGPPPVAGEDDEFTDMPTTVQETPWSSVAPPSQAPSQAPPSYGQQQQQRPPPVQAEMSPYAQAPYPEHQIPEESHPAGSGPLPTPAGVVAAHDPDAAPVWLKAVAFSSIVSALTVLAVLAFLLHERFYQDLLRGP